VPRPSGSSRDEPHPPPPPPDPREPIVLRLHGVPRLFSNRPHQPLGEPPVQRWVERDGVLVRLAAIDELRATIDEDMRTCLANLARFHHEIHENIQAIGETFLSVVDDHFREFTRRAMMQQ